MTHLVRISQAEREGLPFRPATLYNWRHTGKHPEIFIALGGAVFVDTKALESLLEANRGCGSAKTRGRGRKTRR